MAFPGSYAFRITSKEDKYRAGKKFFTLIGFSLMPLLCVLLVSVIYGSDKAGDFFDYTNGGQLFFYVAGIIGAIACLLIFEGGLNPQLSEDYPNPERETERIFMIFYVALAFLISIVVIFSNQSSQEINGSLVNWIAYSCYLISLYFWYLAVLYDNVKADVVGSGAAASQVIADDLSGFNGE